MGVALIVEESGEGASLGTVGEDAFNLSLGGGGEREEEEEEEWRHLKRNGVVVMREKLVGGRICTESLVLWMRENVITNRESCFFDAM